MPETMDFINDLFNDAAPPMPEPEQPKVDVVVVVEEVVEESGTVEEQPTQADDQDEEEDFQPVGESTATPPTPQPHHTPSQTLLEEIREQNRYIRYCEGEIENCKGELKSAKENYDKALSRLRMLCEKLTKPLGDGEDDDKPLLAVPGKEEEGKPTEESKQNTADYQAIPSQPVRVHLLKNILEDTDDPNSPVLATAGEIHEVLEKQYETTGEIWINLGETNICLEPDEFEVVEWKAELANSIPQPAESTETSPASLKEFLGISDNQAAKFATAGIDTVQQLKDKLAENFDLTSIPGVGKAKAEKFAQMVADYS